MESYSDYSNAQLKRKINEIQNEYDSTKEKIDGLCNHMEELEKEYSRVMTELNKRKTLD
jgi:peptidoglycan hydrolase CwlO-like protein